MIEGFLQDARVALRSFARRPSFLIVAIVTLGLGVGAMTTIYSVVHGVLLAPLPYANPDRIVRVGKISEGRAGILAMSALDLRDVQERNRSFEALAASRPTGMTILGDGEPELLRGAMVSAEFFRVLGVQPAAGRAWTPEDDEPGGAPIAVISHGLWQRRWAADPALLGQSVTLDGSPFTVLGIMPADFRPPEALGQQNTDVWVPLAFLNQDSRSNRRDQFLQVVGRVRDGLSLEAARVELHGLGEAISRDFPEPGERVFGLSSLHAETVGRVGLTVIPLLGAVGLLLAIACANLANLLLVRASQRGREMAVRTALGARRRRVVRQLLTESLVLGVLGGALGVAVATAGVRGFVAFGPRDIPRLAEVTVNGSVLLFAVGVSLLTSLVFGLLPALRGSSTDLTESLGSGGRGPGTSAKEERLRNGLVVAETALSFVLVVAAGLLVSSFVRLARVELGFEADDLYVVSVTHRGDPDAGEATNFFDSVVGGIARLPGVSAVGATVNLPLSGNRRMLLVSVPGTAYGEDGGYSANYQQVTENYFSAMGIRALRGRVFTERDNAEGPRVAVVNEALARALFGEDNAVGQRLTTNAEPGGLSYEIVGLVADVRQQRLDAPGEPELYISFRQSPSARMDIVARTSVPNAMLLRAMREQVWAVRPDLPVRAAFSMSDSVARSVASPLFYTLLLGVFALLAVSLAVVGVYGTLAYTVSLRTREMGIRMALGASAGSVLGMVMRRGMALVALGVGIGVIIALLSTRALASFLFGVAPTDAPTMVGGILAVLAAAALASAIPARKAATLDPMTSLRHE